MAAVANNHVGNHLLYLAPKNGSSQSVRPTIGVEGGEFGAPTAAAGDLRGCRLSVLRECQQPNRLKYDKCNTKKL